MVVKVKNLKVKKRDLGKEAALVDGVLNATNFKAIFDRGSESFISRSIFTELLLLSCCLLYMFIRPSLASVCLSS